MTKECKQQFTLRITQANATQMVVILYEMTLQYLADAEQAAEEDVYKRQIKSRVMHRTAAMIRVRVMRRIAATIRTRATYRIPVMIR